MLSTKSKIALMLTIALFMTSCSGSRKMSSSETQRERVTEHDTVRVTVRQIVEDTIMVYDTTRVTITDGDTHRNHSQNVVRKSTEKRTGEREEVKQRTAEREDIRKTETRQQEPKRQTPWLAIGALAGAALTILINKIRKDVTSS